MIELTGIGPENREAFEELMFGLDPSDYELCIGAIWEEEAAGVAFYNTIGDMLMLDYIFVSPAFRRKGIGTALVEDFLEEIKAAEPASLYINYPERAEDLYGFTRALDFKLFRDGVSYRTRVQTLLESKDLDRLLKACKGDKSILSFDQLTRRERKTLSRKLEENDMEGTIINDSSLSLKLSLAALNKNGEPVSCILCHQSRTQILLDYMVNFSADPSYLVELLGALKEAVIREELQDNDLIFVTMNESMEKLPKKLVGSDGILEGEGTVICGVRKLNEKED